MASAVIPIHEIAARGLRHDNVVTIRLLALCPMLAVSVQVQSAAILGALTMAVMAVAGAAISSIRHITPDGVRLPVFLLLVAILVAAADMGLEAAAPHSHRQLGIFLPLIITNCAVLARLELFARRQPPLAAFVDGVGCGCGLWGAIVLLAAAREYLATGGIAPWFSGTPLISAAALPVGGFMLFALLLATARWCGFHPPPINHQNTN